VAALEWSELLDHLAAPPEPPRTQQPPDQTQPVSDLDQKTALPDGMFSPLITRRLVRRLIKYQSVQHQSPRLARSPNQHQLQQQTLRPIVFQAPSTLPLLLLQSRLAEAYASPKMERTISLSDTRSGESNSKLQRPSFCRTRRRGGCLKLKEHV
jgi:hypothetical protein